MVLLTGAGRHFGAGHDLSELTVGAYDPAIFARCSSLMQQLATCEVPTVAAVQGCAFAAGCQLAASCDIVLAAPGARFATPGTKIGLFCSTPSVALTRAATPKVAAEMLFAARELSAEEALNAGIVSRVVPGGDEASTLEEEALITCTRIAASPREVLVAGKALLLRQRGQDLGSAYDMASEAMVRGMATGVAREGIGAFLEKRPPAWPSEASEMAEVLKLLPHGVAVVGVSPNAQRDSAKVFASLRKAAVPTYAVNPRASEIAGGPSYGSLAGVPQSFAVVDVFRASGPPAAEAIQEAMDLAAQGRGVRAIWLQEGVRAPAAETKAREAGLLVVADKCLKVEMEKVLPPTGRIAAAGAAAGSAPAAKL